MCYSIESRHQKLKGFFSFAENMGKKIDQKIRRTFSQKLFGLDKRSSASCATKTATDAFKTASKRAIE